jgi:hypothetical protein
MDRGLRHDPIMGPAVHAGAAATEYESGAGVVDTVPPVSATVMRAEHDENEEEEIEISVEDFLEVLPQPREEILRCASISDGVTGHTTSISEVIVDLARLSDPNSVPRVRGELDSSERAPYEALLLAMIASQMSIAAIMQTSPLGDEETLRVLARLVSAQVITLAA